MDQVNSSKTAECPIDILTDDILIAIFAFLSLYERLMIMRGSKRYNKLFSNSQAWTDIDFWQKQQVSSMKKTNWMFPANQHDVLAFLKKYTSGSLKAIYLKVVSKEILTFLRHNCSNLKVLSFLSGNNFFKSADIVEGLQYSFPNTLPLSQSIEVCQLTLNLESRYLRHFSGDFIAGTILSENVLTRLGTYQRLRRLTLHKFFLTSSGIAGLSSNNLPDIRDLCLLQVHVPDTSHDNIDLIDEALSSLFKFKELTSFKLSTAEPSKTQVWFNIDHFFRGIGKWQNLKCLGLSGIAAPSRDTFSSVISGLPQLLELELEGQIITDENLVLISQQLKNLTFLELKNGAYTTIGVRALFGHPSIERLCLLEHFQPRPLPSWLLAVYDVVLSLPKITYVKLIGNRLIALHAKENIPKMIRNVKIDVENSEIQYEEQHMGRRARIGLLD